MCLPREAKRSGFHPLSVSLDHAAAVGRLPAHHRDPFDRLLVVQAQMNGLTIVTAEPKIKKYDVSTLDPTR